MIIGKNYDMYLFFFFSIGKLHTHLVGLELMISPSNQLVWKKEVPIKL